MSKIEIFKMIETGQITAEEGFQLIKGMSQRSIRGVMGDEVIYATSHWTEKPLTGNGQINTLLLFTLNESIHNDFKAILPHITIISVLQGDRFTKNHDLSYTINPESENDYTILFSTLKENDLLPDTIIHNWAAESFNSSPEILTKQLYKGAYSAFLSIQNLIKTRFKNKVNYLFCYPQDNPQYSGMSGFAKTVSQENPKLNCKAIALDSDVSNYISLLIRESNSNDKSLNIKYVNHKRFTKDFYPEPQLTGTTSLKDGGVYLLTGGAGGLGIIFSNHIINKVKPILILTGRSELNEEKLQILNELRRNGATVEYKKADVSNAGSVTSLIKDIKQIYGKLDGVVHSAGLLRDSFVFNKPFSDFKTVTSPKVYGAALLDNATKDELLDFFMVFSSTTGAFGNPGQCDYAFANAYLDDFCAMRDKLQKEGKRHGKSISINWPLWESGGMNVDEKVRERLKQTTGMIPLKTEYGLQAFDDALKVDATHMVVIEGIKDRIYQTFNIQQGISPQNIPVQQTSTSQQTPLTASSGGGGSVGQVEKDLTSICSELLRVEEADIDLDVDLNEYGLDSILMMDLMNKIEELYGDTIEPNAIAENPSIKALSGYIIDQGIVKTTNQQQSTQSATINLSMPAQPVEVQQKMESIPVVAQQSSDNVEKKLAEICSELLRVEQSDIDYDVDLNEYGLDSILMMDLMNKIEEAYGDTIEPNAIAEHSSIHALAQYLINEGIAKASPTQSAKPSSTAPPVNPVNQQVKPVQTAKPVITRTPPTAAGRFVQQSSTSPAVRASSVKKGSHKIAIIGQACRLPLSNSPEEFWENLKQGRDLVTEVPQNRWDVNLHFSTDKKEPYKSYSKWAGFIDNIDLFDADYFGYTEKDAMIMDPQHRIMLELSQELFDRAGFSKEDISKTKTAVYIGATESPYVRDNRRNFPDAYLKHYIVGRIQNMLAARISDFFNLTGDAYTMDTACSSSLVAIHQACQSIRNGENDMAIAGGVELILDEWHHIGFSKSGALCDGPHSFVFDERAKGFVLGEGAGLVLLKDYDKAIADGDIIYGTIIGSAVNNDGHTMGLTVPSMDGQKDVIQKAIDDSGITPDTITYLEAHGTGTLLGDPIEIKGAGQIYRKYTEKTQYCAVGAVKSNMGHALHAAGVAGVLKIILSMQNQYIPPTLHCERPHPRFKFEESPFYPALQGRAWQPPQGIPRRAAISSFGFGGTNVHAILEECPAGYQPKRQPLSIIQFNHKRYWIGQDVLEIDPDENMFLNELIPIFTQALQIKDAEIDSNRKLMDYNPEGAKFYEFNDYLEKKFDEQIDPEVYFKYPTLKLLTSYLFNRFKNKVVIKSTDNLSAKTVIDQKLVDNIDTSLELDVKTQIINDLQNMFADLIGLKPDKVKINAGFYDQGLESNDLLEFVKRLEKRLGEDLYPTLLFEYTTINSLAEFLVDEYSSKYTF